MERRLEIRIASEDLELLRAHVESLPGPRRRGRSGARQVTLSEWARGVLLAEVRREQLRAKWAADRAVMDRVAAEIRGDTSRTHCPDSLRLASRAAISAAVSGSRVRTAEE